VDSILLRTKIHNFLLPDQVRFNPFQTMLPVHGLLKERNGTKPPVFICGDGKARDTAPRGNPASASLDH